MCVKNGFSRIKKRIFIIFLMTALLTNSVSFPVVASAEETDWNCQVGLRWVTPDPTEEKEMTWSGITTGDVLPKYEVSIKTSNIDYEAGEIEVRIPAALWKNRSGTDVIPTLFSLPKNGDAANDMPYSYKLETVAGVQYVVITNYQKVPAATNTTFQIGYEIGPMSSEDMSKGVLKAEGTAKHGSDPAEPLASEEIEFTLDTELDATSLTKIGSIMRSWDKATFGDLPAEIGRAHV